MTFPLSIFLIPYFILLAVWLILSLVAVFHMLKFGFKTFATFVSVFLYIGVSLIMLNVSYYYIKGIDWNANVSIFEIFIDNNEIIEDF